MKKGKRVLGVMIFSILISISFVSAGFWGDLFSFGEDSDLEGELPAAFDASVQLQNAPPTIITVYDVIDNVFTGNPSNEITPFVEGVNDIEIRFLAQDPNGAGDLPGGSNPFLQSSAVGDLGIGGVNIEVYVTSPIFGTQVLAGAGCSRMPACPDAGGCTNNQMEFSCTVPMQYYFEPGVNNWQLYVGVTDVGAGIGDNNAKTFTYYILTSYKISNVAFSGLQWAGITLSGTNQLPNNDPLELKNIGNVNIGSGEITGQDLSPDGGQTGDSMPVSSFSVSVQEGGGTPAECVGTTANALSNGVVVPIVTGGAPTLIYGNGLGGAPLEIGEELNFCLFAQLDTTGLTFSETDYSSTAVKLNPWDLTLP